MHLSNLHNLHTLISWLRLILTEVFSICYIILKFIQHLETCINNESKPKLPLSLCQPFNPTFPSLLADVLYKSRGLLFVSVCLEVSRVSVWVVLLNSDMFNNSFQQSSVAIFVCRWDRMNQSNTPSLLQRNCLWFSKGPSKICGQSGKQISIQWVKRELGELPGTDVRKKIKGLKKLHAHLFQTTHIKWDWGTAIFNLLLLWIAILYTLNIWTGCTELCRQSGDAALISACLWCKHHAKQFASIPWGQTKSRTGTWYQVYSGACGSRQTTPQRLAVVHERGDVIVGNLWEVV